MGEEQAMTALTRREMLAATTVGTVIVAMPAWAQTPPASLNALAKAKGMRFGSCFAWSPAGAGAERRLT